MKRWSELRLQDFLSAYPQMRLIELSDKRVIVEGHYNLNAQMEGYEVIQCQYRIRVTFPVQYPKALPQVVELDRRIPRKMDYHIYSDGSFCLGSNIKLKSVLFEHPTATDLIETVISPFLYKISYKLKYDVVPFGELDHGVDGLIDDYLRIFKVEGKSSVLRVLQALGKRKRDANKVLCPCGCNKRIGKCKFRFALQNWRKLEKRSWFRKHFVELTSGTI